MVSSPSSFLQPIPEDLIVKLETERYADRITSRRRAADWSDRAHREWADEPGGLMYDYTDSQDVSVMPELAEGIRVRHPRFGTGTVVSLDGSGADLKAMIEFDEEGPKKVVVKYANLELE